MAYKQKWGVSRKRSPLNNQSQGFGPDKRYLGKDSEIYKANFGSPNAGTANTVDVDPSRNDIVQQNNKLSTNQLRNQIQGKETKMFTPGIDPKKHFLKQVVKAKAPKASILGKVAKFAGKRASGFLDVFLGSQNAYAPPRYNDKYFEDQEREFQYKRDVEGMTKKEIMEWDNMSEEAKQFVRNSKKPSSKYQPEHTLSQGN